MKRKIKERLQAIALRKRGFSVNEIVQRLRVAKGSVSVWVRNVPLSSVGKTRLLTRITESQFKAAASKRAKTATAIEQHRIEALKDLVAHPLDAVAKKNLCALMYWCEGAKQVSQGVAFINSDPNLVATFLHLFRASYSIDERKFRVVMHLHEYHHPLKQRSFWARITGIPATQFTKPYIKPHTGKRVREGYPGCVSIRYYDNDMLRQLMAMASVLFGSVGRTGP